jgi:hypothetical protein
MANFKSVGRMLLHKRFGVSVIRRAVLEFYATKVELL